MILGRQRELARIDALTTAAREGAGGALVVRGAAGIGKTALLEAARVRASGMRVLRADGVETEAQLPFAALAALLDPLRDRFDRLPAPQAAALAGALALGPPVPGDRLAVCVATLGVLRAAAADEPVLVLVDDAHWVDPGSAECLLFAARRLAGTRAALLLAVRDPEGERHGAFTGVDTPPALAVAPLADEDARAILAARAPDLAGDVRDAVVAAAAGNPLALIEIAGLLTPDERRGRAPLPEPLRPGGRLAAVFERRVAVLPADARDALVVAAAAGGGDVATIWRACDAAGIDRRALEAAETAGLVRLARGTLHFAHPLVRGAAYHGAPDPQRRAAHRALAAVVPTDRRAWHLAAAAAGPDEAAAQALVEAGVAAAGRRGAAEAATAFERAAEKSPEPEQRARRLVRAARSWAVAGQMARAAALVDDAIALGTPAGRDPRTLHTRSLLLLASGRVAAGFALLKAIAEGAAQVADPAVAAFLLADAAMAALIAGDLRETHALGERAAALLGDAGDARARANVLAGASVGRVFRGQGPAARAALPEIEALLAHVDPFDWVSSIRIHSLAIHLCIALDEYERARTIADPLLGLLEEAGALGTRASPLSHAADAAHRRGEWDVAWAETAEAIQLARETTSDETLVRGLAIRARLAAARGLEDDARGSGAEALAISERCGIGAYPPYVHAALGFLELGHGRVDAAIERLEPLAAALDAVHGLVHPTIIPWRPDLCEAYVMAGRLDDARRHAAVLAHEAELHGGAAGRALAARAEGLVAEEFDAPFAAALASHAERPMPFERARTLLAWGGRLHRARRRAEARPPLREAEAVFAALGAAPWRERAAAELRAAGAVRRARRAAADDELTPQEIRVAAAIARGLTIREAAAALFLSPKTVDFHLQHVYAKLGIRSRAQLAVAAVERGWVGGPPA